MCVRACMCVCAQDSEPGQLWPSVGACELHLFTVSLKQRHTEQQERKEKEGTKDQS